MPIRWGLCCQFVDAPITFRRATHRYVSSRPREDALRHLAEIVRHNAESLRQAVEHCRALGIGAFRVTSQLFPLATHPESGYRLEEIDPAGAIASAYREAGEVARRLDVRLSFHPDQFVVLNSEREPVVESAIAELALNARAAELTGAAVITLHGGSAAGGKPAALHRLAAGLARLPAAARHRLALENDDRQFTPADLLPFCERHGIPFVYDVHHHRTNPDALSIAAATRRAAATWGGREPFLHISSPRDGWESPNPRAHADHIDPADFPREWCDLEATIDVEAKAKERAVVKLAREWVIGCR